MNFFSFWYGPSLSKYEQLCMKSFIDHGHEYHLYSYADIEGVPDGVKACDASGILPEEQVFFYPRGRGKGGVSAFANLFRYTVLERYGGFWVDTDVVCLSATIDLPDLYFGREDGKKINNAILRFPEQHPVMVEAKKRALSVESSTMKWGDTGPVLLTQVCTDLGLDELATPPEFAYPVPPSDWADLLRPSKCEEIQRRTQGAPLLHLWNENYRQGGVRKDVNPPADSFIRTLSDRHKIDWPFPACYDERMINDLQIVTLERRELKRLRKLEKFEPVRRVLKKIADPVRSLKTAALRLHK